MSRLSRWFDRSGEPIEDPWAVLGLEPGSSLESIREAYRPLVLAHPPERDPEAFQRVNAAYRLLTDDALVEDRHHGAIAIGSPEDYGLPSPGPRATTATRSFEERLAGELLLYALLEAIRPGTRPAV